MRAFPCGLKDVLPYVGRDTFCFSFYQMAEGNAADLRWGMAYLRRGPGAPTGRVLNDRTLFLDMADHSLELYAPLFWKTGHQDILGFCWYPLYTHLNGR